MVKALVWLNQVMKNTLTRVFFIFRAFLFFDPIFLVLKPKSLFYRIPKDIKLVKAAIY